ncbi:MAG: hypothetical protein JW809_04240 [Pirellulales bacterium]|nr:hypothetical protein [Pirellulales bacterium]
MHTFSGMTDARLRQLIGRFGSVRVAVVGDFFLDKYLDVDTALAERSIETGKTAHQVTAVRTSPGAAGTVVCNLAALGAGAIWAVGWTGDDGESFDLRKGLAALGCQIDHLHAAPDRMTPTYLKPRDRARAGLEGEHDRYDTKNRRPAPPALDHKVLASLDALLPNVDAVAVLDQVEEEDRGVVTTMLREALAERVRAYPKVVFWADSRRRIRRFRGAIVKPNQFEALGVEQPPLDAPVDLAVLAEALRTLGRETGGPIFVTRGPQGMAVFDREELTVVPGVRIEGPVDPTGAGDSATAGALMALASGATLPEAALVGNLVASLTVTQLATTGTARPDELPPRLAQWREQQS